MKPHEEITDQRIRVGAMPEDELRNRVDRLLEQCSKEARTPGVPNGAMLHVSEIYWLLGVGPGPDYSGLANIGEPSAAEHAAVALEGASVVKAFNTQFAQVQANPTLLGTTLDALYAADDDAAAATVAELASSIGFRPVRVGPLTAARELEALAWLNIRLQMITSGSWQSSFVVVAPPVQALAA